MCFPLIRVAVLPPHCASRLSPQNSLKAQSLNPRRSPGVIRCANVGTPQDSALRF